MYRYRHGYGGATPRHTSDNHTVTHTFFNFTHTAPLSLYAESATHADLRSLLSREPLVCLPDTHNSRASLTHDGGLARSSGVPLSLAMSLACVGCRGPDAFRAGFEPRLPSNQGPMRQQTKPSPSGGHGRGDTVQETASGPLGTTWTVGAV